LQACTSCTAINQTGVARRAESTDRPCGNLEGAAKWVDNGRNWGRPTAAKMGVKRGSSLVIRHLTTFGGGKITVRPGR